MKAADPTQPCGNIHALISDQDCRRYLIGSGLLKPRDEDLPWHTNYKRAYTIQRARREAGVDA